MYELIFNRQLLHMTLEDTKNIIITDFLLFMIHIGAILGAKLSDKYQKV